MKKEFTEDKTKLIIINDNDYQILSCRNFGIDIYKTSFLMNIMENTKKKNKNILRVSSQGKNNAVIIIPRDSSLKSGDFVKVIPIQFLEEEVTKTA